MITEITEIRNVDGGMFHLFKDDLDNNCISIIENGKFSSINLSFFTKSELIKLMRHIEEEVSKK